MQYNVLEKFDELFKDADDLTIPQLEGFVHEVLAFFETLRETLLSGSTEEKQAALEVASKLQKRLEDLAEKSMQKAGMTPDQLKSFIGNAQNFSPSEWKAYKSAENEISEYKTAHPDAPSPAPLKPKKKSSSKKEPWRKI